ncbi:MAG TPA: 6,7-dimethyl-8-ribityllumazine synthase [Oligoflexia bacterium]|nr:6,7-dimethyl-8-ribityllumazine synthase [Oligoflexia bacterium]
MRIALVVASFNPEITGGLETGARKYLNEQGISDAQIERYDSPGAFEIPLIAKKLASTGRFAGVVCLGAVIKGDTMHFEFISLGATIGILNASLQTDTPISFGVLTTITEEQANVRSRDDAHNKGREAAAACIASVRVLQSIQ